MSKKKDVKKRPWDSMAAFGDSVKYGDSSKENAKASPKIKQNSHAGSIGLAGNIEFNKNKFKLYHKKGD